MHKLVCFNIVSAAHRRPQTFQRTNCIYPVVNRKSVKDPFQFHPPEKTSS